MKQKPEKGAVRSRDPLNFFGSKSLSPEGKAKDKKVVKFCTQAGYIKS